MRAEVKDTTEGFWHRLVRDDGRGTAWASYTQATFLDGMVGITPYFHSGTKVEIITPERYCELTCVR